MSGPAYAAHLLARACWRGGARVGHATSIRAGAPPPPRRTDPLPVALRRRRLFRSPRMWNRRTSQRANAPFERLFAVGDVLFHTALQRSRRRRQLRTKDGSRVTRFAPSRTSRARLAGMRRVPCGAVSRIRGPRTAASHATRGRRRSTSIGDSLFGDGILQLLAQEMTEELQATRESAAAAAE